MKDINKKIRELDDDDDDNDKMKKLSIKNQNKDQKVLDLEDDPDIDFGIKHLSMLDVKKRKSTVKNDVRSCKKSSMYNNPAVNKVANHDQENVDKETEFEVSSNIRFLSINDVLKRGKKTTASMTSLTSKAHSKANSKPEKAESVHNGKVAKVIKGGARV